MNDDFSFKFPDLDLSFKDIDIPTVDNPTLTKIYEYLANDIEEQNILIHKLLELEKRLDSFIM